MLLDELREKIDRIEARLAVIGLGYVGLPVACAFASAGFDVVGLELRSDRVECINRGVSPIDGNEPGLAELLADAIAAQRFRATADYLAIADRDVILIAVETPVDENNVPHYQALRSAAGALAKELKPGALVIVESTIAPGTMAGVVRPALETAGLQLNRDFYLGNCPERVMPGKLLRNLHGVSRVVGGMTPETAETMLALYRHIVQADLDATDCVTAELVKTVENAYRDVQIAFANEVALICEAVGGDVWRVRGLVNKSPGRQMHLPGAGVGGHCIPKDPWLLAHGVHDKGVPLRVIPAARAVNNSMPLHVVDLVQQALRCDVCRARILVLGYAYLEESDDTRNSPSEILVRHLCDLGAQVLVHDPYVSGYQGNILAMARGCDAAVVMVKHRAYTELDLAALARALRAPVVVDARAVLDRTRAEMAGLQVWGVGLPR